MLNCYFDDSGTRERDVVLWSGVFGHQNQWDYFNELWAAKIAAPSPGKLPISRFHMYECQGGYGEFGGWGRTATDYLVQELGEIINKAGLYSDGCAVAKKDWDELVPKDLQGALGDADGYCLRICYLRATMWANRFAPGHDIAFVFDQRPEREFEVGRISEVFRRFSTDSGTPKPASLCFEDSRKIMPLQAADLIAWEECNFTRDSVRLGRDAAKLRPEFKRLTKSRRIQFGIADRKSIKQMVKLCAERQDKWPAVAELMTREESILE